MVLHQGLFLAVTISCFLANIALAGVLQPAEHQYNSNPRYLQHQSVSQHWIRSPTEQYRAEQLQDQESKRYLQTTESNEDPKEARRKMDFIRHMDGGHSLQPLMVHNQRKRSDPASTDKRVKKLEAEDFTTSVLPRLLMPKLPKNMANAIQYVYPYLSERVKDTTVFQIIVNTLAHLLNFYSLQEKDISMTRIINMINMIKNKFPSWEDIRNMWPFGTAEPSQDETSPEPSQDKTSPKPVDPLAGGRASTAQDKKITNMNMISTAEPSQDKTLQIPFYSEMTPEAYQYPIVGAPYFDRTGRPSPNFYSSYPNNYNYYYTLPEKY